MIPLLVVADETRLPDDLDGLGVVEVKRANALPFAAEVDRERPTAVLLSRKWRDADPAVLRALASRAAIIVAGAPDDSAPPNGVIAELAVAWLPHNADANTTTAALRGALLHASTVSAAHARHDELTELARIGVALSNERDLTTLLKMILSQARRLVNADAGSLYLVDRPPRGQPPTTMKFTLAQNHTLPDLPFREQTVTINARSLAGYVAVSAQPLVIDDVYHIANDVPYHFNRAFDQQVGYRTKSVLVIPMRSHRDEIVGVLQLINRKQDDDARLDSPEQIAAQVLPFDEHSVALSSALASQAAVAIENKRLYDDIEGLFDGIVTAAVHAIEQRDPTTSGHSSRVTAYTMGLAKALNAGKGCGPYRDTRFTPEEMRELKYACLLHDFGKVAVREAVLQKEKKLYPGKLDIIRHRFAYLLQLAEVAAERERVEYLLKNGEEGFAEANTRIEERRRVKREEIQRTLDAVVRANEPSILAADAFAELQSLAERRYADDTGSEQPLLSADELRFLSIRKGNLDDRERKEIESHATQSYNFLTRIPWTDEFRGIPDIVWGHHEKLNGRGYPRGIGAEQLGVQTRMMTIADIFDALTAADRPYKKAISHSRAVEILAMEVKDGALDEHLFQTFVDEKIWEVVHEEVVRSTKEARATGAVGIS